MNTERDIEIDTRIAELMGRKPLDDDSGGWISPDGEAKHWPGPPEYSLKIADGMEVVAKIHTLLFSKRKIFKETLQRLITERLEMSGLIHTEEIIFHVTPRDICLAALAIEDVK